MRIDGPQVYESRTLLRPLLWCMSSDQCCQVWSLSASKGEIVLNWLHEADGRLILRWKEMGGPAVKMPHAWGLRHADHRKNDWPTERQSPL